MLRKIIEIDEAKCNGCGNCIPGCPEGALQVIDGKARLVSDLFCDGLGACVGECPTGAMRVVERESEPYDERRVMVNIIRAGTGTIRAHLKHLQGHGAKELYDIAVAVLQEQGIEIPKCEDEKPASCGCSGSMNRTIKPSAICNETTDVPSQLQQWPTQLHLLNPAAGFFANADLLICADCVPFALANFHQKYLCGKVVINFCPKLDQSAESYIGKLTQILQQNKINSITVLKMEVPCCGGTEAYVRQAIQQANIDIKVQVDMVSISGNIKSSIRS